MKAELTKIKALQLRVDLRQAQLTAATKHHSVKNGLGSLKKFETHLLDHRKKIFSRLNTELPSAKALAQGTHDIGRLKQAKRQLEEEGAKVGVLQKELGAALLQLQSYRAQVEKLDQMHQKAEQLQRVNLQSQQEEEHLSISAAVEQVNAQGTLEQESVLKRSGDILAGDRASVAPAPSAAAAAEGGVELVARGTPPFVELFKEHEYQPVAFHQRSVAGGEAFVLSFAGGQGQKLDFEFRQAKGGQAELVLRTDDQKERRRLWREKLEIERAMKAAGFETKSIRVEYGP